MHSTYCYRQISLENGIQIIVNDLSRGYFGDYSLVRLEIICRFREPFETADGASSGKAGTMPEYKRIIERMGVPSAELETAKESIFSDFLNNSSAYLSSPDFPSKLATSVSSKTPRKSLQYSENWS